MNGVPLKNSLRQNILFTRETFLDVADQKSRILLTPILYMLNYFAILQKMLFSRKQTLLPAAFPDPLQLWHIVIILIISEKLCLSIRQASVL